MTDHPYKKGDHLMLRYNGRLVRAKVVACYFGETGGFVVNAIPDTWSDDSIPLSRDVRVVWPVDVVGELAEIGRFLPTEADIGRGVIYTPYPGAKTEDGAITSVTDDYVFVRYQDQHPSAGGKATRYKDLQWLSK